MSGRQHSMKGCSLFLLFVSFFFFSFFFWSFQLEVYLTLEQPLFLANLAFINKSVRSILDIRAATVLSKFSIYK